MANNKSILKLKPPLKDYIWGGTRLRDEYGKISDAERIAESWELSCHPDGLSIIDGGEYDGITLSEYLRENPNAVGTNCKDFKCFPVLIKLIDAKDDLSVQVHPDNDYAFRHEGEQGKTEMLYIVDCEKGAELIYGFKNKISRGDFKKAIEENTLLDEVKRIKVKKGDVFFISPGTLHAIGKGILIAEIEQNSNTTYRVYDYNRKDADGNTRELNTEKALDVTVLKPAPEPTDYPKLMLKGRSAGTEVQLLADCDYFTALKADLNGTSYCMEADEKSFVHVLTIKGKGEIHCGDTVYPFKKGESFFIPAGMGNVTIKGKCSIINTEINIMEEIT